MLGFPTDDKPMSDLAGGPNISLNGRGNRRVGNQELDAGTDGGTMEPQTIQSTPRILVPRPCAHGRIIDRVLTRGDKPTGQVRCLECGTIFDDPHRVQQ